MVIDTVVRITWEVVSVSFVTKGSFYFTDLRSVVWLRSKDLITNYLKRFF